MFPTEIELKERQVFLHGLRTSGDPAASARANEMERLYHDDNMAVLAKDVYFSAMDEGADEEYQKAPPGWTRGSDNLQLLRERMPALAGVSNEVLLDLLKPDDSGFRAEIYLPDLALVGHGQKPVVVAKGSAGEVMADGSLRDTTKEDFLANNFPQSVGLQTDYYDRSMRLGMFFKGLGIEVELAGHSLGGGMMSAASAVTGYPATTFNAAGLHTETAPRYAQQNPGVQIYDTQKTVTSYQVSKELLNDGLQHNLHQIDTTERRHLARTLKGVASALQTIPQADKFLQDKLEAPPEKGEKHPPFPQNTHEPIRGFLKQLAEKDVDALLRDLPLAAGQVKPITEVKTWDENGRAIDRPDEMGLQELTNFAGPLLEVASKTAFSAHVGQRVGELAAGGGQFAASSMDASGNIIRAATAQGAAVSGAATGFAYDTAQSGVRVGGEALARARELAGQAEATMDDFQGRAQARAAGLGSGALRGVEELDVLPDGIQRWAGAQADRWQQDGQSAQRQNQAEAAEARSDASRAAAGIRDATERQVAGLEQMQTRTQALQHGIIAGSGQWVDTNLDRVATGVTDVSATAPMVGAALAGSAEAVHSASQQLNPIDFYQTSRFATNASKAAGEAEQRHLMSETVLPSMDVHIRARELEIRKEFPSLFPPQTQSEVPNQASPERGDAQASVSRVSSPADPGHADHPMLTQIRGEMAKIDAGVGKPYDDNSERISRCVLAACKDNRDMHPGKGDSLAANALNRVDHLVLGSTGNLFAIEGKFDDPASKRASVPIDQAMRTPVEQSDQKLEAANRTIAQELDRDRTLNQQQGRNADNPGVRMS